MSEERTKWRIAKFGLNMTPRFGLSLLNDENHHYSIVSDNWDGEQVPIPNRHFNNLRATYREGIKAINSTSRKLPTPNSDLFLVQADVVWVDDENVYFNTAHQDRMTSMYRVKIGETLRFLTHKIIFRGKGKEYFYFEIVD